MIITDNFVTNRLEQLTGNDKCHCNVLIEPFSKCARGLQFLKQEMTIETLQQIVINDRET